MPTFSVPDAFTTSARALNALADRNRVWLLCLLGSRGQMSVGEIAGHFTLSRPAVSHHLKVMLDGGLVLNEKSGQEVYYWVDCDGIVRALRGLADAVEVCCQGNKRCPPRRQVSSRKSKPEGVRHGPEAEEQR